MTTPFQDLTSRENIEAEIFRSEKGYDRYLTDRQIAALEALGIAIEALEYIKGSRYCDDKGCTCRRDTAHIALEKIRALDRGEG